MTLTDEVINNFIYSGFESMSKYIEKRRNKLIIDTNKLMEANNNN